MGPCKVDVEEEEEDAEACYGGLGLGLVYEGWMEEFGSSRQARRLHDRGG